MATVVQKFGGTSVGSIERIQAVAKRVWQTHEEGTQTVVIVSAMAGETNRLLELSRSLGEGGIAKDLLLASGEQVSVALVSMALDQVAGRQVSSPLLGYQVGLRTDSAFTAARITGCDTSVLEGNLKEGKIPVVAGFQGVDPSNRITTLGRGGSDTSAVAVAAAMKASECEIYTDVEGVFTADPREMAQARKIDFISYEEMMELSSLGTKVLQVRAAELAALYGVRLHVRSSFNQEEGTRIVSGKELEKHMPLEKISVTAVASEGDQAAFTILGMGSEESALSPLFLALAKEGIVIDVIVQGREEHGQRIRFSLHQKDLKKASGVLAAFQEKRSGIEVETHSSLAKVSIVGVGMQHHTGIAAKMFQTLEEEGIGIHLVSTSEIKVSCLIAQSEREKAVQSLHARFGLGG